jgi:hypothetical protein
VVQRHRTFRCVTGWPLSAQANADGGRYDVLDWALASRVRHDGGLVEEDKGAVRLEPPLPIEDHALRFHVIDQLGKVNFTERPAALLKKSDDCAGVSRCPRGIETKQQNHTGADQDSNLSGLRIDRRVANPPNHRTGRTERRDSSRKSGPESTDHLENHLWSWPEK